jgi:hypothetical protein
MRRPRQFNHGLAVIEHAVEVRCFVASGDLNGVAVRSAAACGLAFDPQLTSVRAEILAVSGIASAAGQKIIN